jgi:putative phosphoribosyl transferase
MILPTRIEAGRRLAEALQSHAGRNAVVYAVSPGGVRVAHEVAVQLGAPLDIIGTLMLRVPGRKHLAIGAIAPGSVVLDERAVKTARLPEQYVQTLVKLARHEMEDHERVLRGSLRAVDCAGRPAVLVDDGLVGTFEVAAALRSLRLAGATKVMFAAPACRQEVSGVVEREGAECVLLGTADRRTDRMCDDRFSQTTAPDVQAMLRQARETVPA